MTRYRMIDSPIGPLTLAGEGSVLTNLRMVDQTYEPDRADWMLDDRAFPDAVEQLEAYFAGERQRIRFATGHGRDSIPAESMECIADHSLWPDQIVRGDCGTNWLTECIPRRRHGEWP